MKFQIEKDSLLKLLAPAQSLIEKRNVIPILSKILLRVESDQLHIFSTDQDNSLQCSTPILKGTPGATCVDSSNLFEIVKELPKGLININKPASREGIEVKTPSSRFNIIGLKASDFPIFPNLEEPSFFKIPAHTLLSLIDKTSYCASTDETRYHLNGVFLEKNEDTLRLVATDGHRLSYADEEGMKNVKLKEGIIVPKKGLLAIHRLLSTEDEEDVSIAIHPPRILVKFSSFLLSVKLIEGKYPNYRQLLPKTSKIKIRINKEALIQSLRRVSVLSSAQSKNVLFSWSKSKKQLTLTSQDPDLGDAKEEIATEEVNGDIEIRFNARYVLETLQHIKDEEILMEMNTSSTPGVIKGSDTQGVSIVMPMKL